MTDVDFHYFCLDVELFVRDVADLEYISPVGARDLLKRCNRTKTFNRRSFGDSWCFVADTLLQEFNKVCEPPKYSLGSKQRNLLRWKILGELAQRLLTLERRNECKKR